jgi:hypothetical protein
MSRLLESLLPFEAFTEGSSFKADFKLNLPKGINTSNACIYIRPAELDLKEFISPSLSNSLTVFTFTVGSGFSQVVKDSIKSCSGEVKLVFGFTDKANRLKICQELISLSKNTKSLSVFIRTNSHIKLFQRDDYVIIGSQNYSVGADSNPKDELLVEFKKDGRQITQGVMDYFKDIDPGFNPVEVKGKEYEELNHALNLAVLSQKGTSRYSNSDLKDQLLEPIYEYFKLKNISIDEFNINNMYPRKLDHTDSFIDGLNVSISNSFDCQPLVEVAESLLTEAIDSNLDLVAEYVPYECIDDMANENANLSLCEEGYSDSEAGDEFCGLKKDFVDRVDFEQQAITDNNKQIISNFIEISNETFYSKLEDDFGSELL